VRLFTTSVHQAAKLVAALLRVAGVTAGLAESSGSLLPGLWLTPPAGWLPRTGIGSGTLRSVIEYGLPLPFCCVGRSVAGGPVASLRLGVRWQAELLHWLATLHRPVDGWRSATGLSRDFSGWPQTWKSWNILGFLCTWITQGILYNLGEKLWQTK